MRGERDVPPSADLRVLVAPVPYLTAMSCTPGTPAMLELLEALTAWPDVDTEDLRRRPEWGQALAWGWVMASGELTGTGLAHVRELPRGIVSE
jgi:hypothetical protein